MKVTDVALGAVLFGAIAILEGAAAVALVDQVRENRRRGYGR